MTYLLMGLTVLTFAQPLSARSASPTPAQAPASAPAWSPSKDIGVFVFGKNGQTSDQQLKDETDCYAAAKQQSGIDPKAPAPTGKSAEQKAAADSGAVSTNILHFSARVVVFTCPDRLRAAAPFPPGAVDRR